MGVDTWNDAPAASADGWKPDADASAGGWEPDGTNENMTGEFSDANVSKHDAGFGGASADGGCRNCGADGHFARDCPEERKMGACFNCGEEGHSKADCTNPRVEREFDGTCRHCEQQGHMAKDCPSKPASICKLCKAEGHIASECEANRMALNFDSLGIADMSSDDAWKALVEADKEKDVEDIKGALFAYVKATPEVTFVEIESAFRDDNMNTHLIAKEQEVSSTHTIVNLQGKIDQKYVLSVQFTAKPRRAMFAQGWPDSAEENLTRLAEAGIPMDRMVPKCSNCNELGHGSKACPEEKREPEKIVITCANCNEEGHRARDCQQARKSGQKECKNCGEVGHLGKDCPTREPDLCRNCGQEGHRAKYCDQERVMKCRNCDALGHAARDCPEEKNMSRVQCRNCDEMGHTGRECPKPRDWSRVECQNCGEKGHGRARCPNPAKEDEADGGAGADGGWGDNAGGAAAGGDGGWGADEAPAVAADGGW